MLGKLFPESIFSRKLPPAAERRLRLAQARAEESIVRAHVDNALMFMDTLAEDLPFDRAIDTYIRVMGIPEPLASTVATRALVVLGQDLVPFRRRQRGPGSTARLSRKRTRGPADLAGPLIASGRATQGVATGVRAAVSPLGVEVAGAAAAATRAESTIALMTSNGCEPMTMRPPITNDGVERIAAVSAAFACAAMRSTCLRPS
jgi:hypothetical protein